MTAPTAAASSLASLLAPIGPAEAESVLKPLFANGVAIVRHAGMVQANAEMATVKAQGFV